MKRKPKTDRNGVKIGKTWGKDKKDAVPSGDVWGNREGLPMGSVWGRDGKKK